MIQKFYEKLVVYKRNIHRKISLNANATEVNSSWGRVSF